MGRDRWSRRWMVEQCLPLDVSWLRRGGAFADPEAVNFFTIDWTRPFGIKMTLGYCVGRSESEGWAVITDPEELVAQLGSARIAGEYVIPITTTRPHLGGTRYWFTCPVERGGKPCGSRVRRLYLPPDTQVFGCRLCYDLTYRSCREHDPREYKLARDPVALAAALDSKKVGRRLLGFGGFCVRLGWERNARRGVPAIQP